jgi:hypothetical protein
MDLKECSIKYRRIEEDSEKWKGPCMADEEEGTGQEE